MTTDPATALAKTRVNHRGVVDCDIHPMPATPTEMAEFLPARWAKHVASYGARVAQPFRRRKFPDGRNSTCPQL